MTRFCFLTLAISVSILPAARAAPQIPGVAPPHPVALVGGTIHPVSGPAIAGGTLLMHQGKIVAVGTDVPLPNGTEQIDVAGRHVYPGLIAAYSSLGLSEIDAVRATIDQSETGSINPNVRAQVAFNPDSELIPVARSNGVLCALSAPRGGLISGTSAVMQLDGWTWEEMALRPAAGMHVEWPRYGGRQDWMSGSVEQPDAGARDAALQSIRRTLADARAYQAARQSPAAGGVEAEFDARWEAMLPVLAGQTPLVVAADEAPQIESAVALAAAEGLKIVIHGGYEAPLCAELLKRHDVPVIVSSTHRLPLRPSDAYDDPYTVPARLHAAGVRFCISTDEDAWNVRNLPYQAATAAAYGLPPEIALAAVTLFPAQILGVADRVGSLEAGKDATLLVTDGDPLEIATHVTAAYIGGRPVDLSDRHKRLWEKYKEKYRRLGIENP
jgi:imidazolonepropionase-like amidohydrolase